MTPRILSATSPPTPAPSPERLAALYSFTRAQRDANPDGYAANVKWWGDVIGGALRAGKLGPDLLVLKPNGDMLDALANGSQRPRGLGGVIDALEEDGVLMPLGRYDASGPVDAAPSLASRVASAAAGAGWSALARVVPFVGRSADEAALWARADASSLVHLPNVRRAAAAWAAHVKANPPVQYTDGVYSRAGFDAAFAAAASPDPRTKLSSGDMRVLVRWLERDARRIVVDGDVIKISDGGAEAITEADRGAVAVTDALAAVDAQVDAAEAEALACEERARRALRAGKRSTAAAYLRSKKNLDDLVAKRVGAGEQLRNVRRALNQAKGDVEIMSAYEASTAALASALADPRLSPDHIASTTDALADVLADQAEIDDAVRLGTQVATGTAADIDDDELAKELEALVLEEKEERAKEAEAKALREKEEAAKQKEQEAKELAAREKLEKEKKMREERDEREEREAAAVAKAAAMATAGAPGDRPAEAPAARAKASGAEASGADEAWSDRYEDAQQREREEKARAAAERLAREERMLAE